jgi:hypothetical protein
MDIVVSGYFVRYPLSGHSWYAVQYLAGLQQLGHRVTYFEDYGWESSCYDPDQDIWTADPAYGVTYAQNLLAPFGIDDSWCYLAEDGTAHGMTREELTERLRECDLYINLANMNWIPELELCRRRILIDADPVFTQIGGHGMGGPFSRYAVHFTRGENVGKPGCTMPMAGVTWVPTRAPIVLDLWPVLPGDAEAPFTTVMNWTAYGDREYEGRVYGQKDREFTPYTNLPRDAGQPMQIALNAPGEVEDRLRTGGWALVNSAKVTRTPERYQEYLTTSRAEFSVAKHAYVSTKSGWFSERSACYLASGRPVLVQNTGYTRWLTAAGTGVVPFSTREEAIAGVEDIVARYEEHCDAARAIAEEYFDARSILSDLLERSV